MRLRLAVFVVALFAIIVQSPLARPLKLTTKISHAQMELWRCQSKLGAHQTRPSQPPWALPRSRAYRKWVLKSWKKRLTACDRKESLGRRAVELAKRELGTPYRYGGNSHWGFDCSGLTSYVYGRLGISLPHNAASQYYYGRAVDRAHLKPGDLLFFHGLGHVGLYIGHGRMIHAPSYGRRVEIQLLSSRNVEGARRIAIR